MNRTGYDKGRNDFPLAVLPPLELSEELKPRSSRATVIATVVLSVLFVVAAIAANRSHLGAYMVGAASLAGLLVGYLIGFYQWIIGRD